MLSIITLVSGAVAGWVSSMIFYPLETIEARQQVDKSLGSRKMFAALAFVMKKEGLAGVYVGWQGGVCGNAFNWAMYFSLYQSMMMFVSGGQGQASLGVLTQILVGIVTGIVACTIVNPFWVVKYRMVRQHAQNPNAKKDNAYSTFFGTVNAVVQAEGLGQLWSGVLPSWFGSLCGAIQFLLHSEFKRTELVSGSSGLALSLLIFASGCLSSCIATALTYPYQVVRGRVQVAKGGDMKDGIVQLIRKQYTVEGLGSFYSGLDTNLVRQIPTSGTMLVVQEVTAMLLRAIFPGA